MFEPNEPVRYRGRLFNVVKATAPGRPDHIIIEDDEGNAAMVHVSEISQA